VQLRLISDKHFLVPMIDPIFKHHKLTIQRYTVHIIIFLSTCALLFSQAEVYADRRDTNHNATARLRSEYLRLRNIDPTGDDPVHTGGWRVLIEKLYVVSQNRPLDEEGNSLRLMTAEGYLRLYRGAHLEHDLERAQALLAPLISGGVEVYDSQRMDAELLAADIALASKKFDRARKIFQSVEGAERRIKQLDTKARAGQRLQGLYNGTFKSFVPSHDLEVPRIVNSRGRNRASEVGDRPVVVLDPGHGGSDFGAVSELGGEEKEITLDIASRVASILKLRHRFRVHLTRDDDSFVPLARRTAFANLKQASVFISLHVNASERHDAAGLEAYYLDNTNDEASRKLAERENGVVAGGAVDDLSFMLSDLIQSGKLEDSILLTRAIEAGIRGRVITKNSGLRSLGVKKAPFFVLVGAHAPCSLIEMFFVDNPNDAKMFRRERFRELLASGIAEGIAGFLTR
jgi:N-acetylmuramoyl-L-alanine amidase